MSLPDLKVEIAFGDPPLTQNETTNPGGPGEILGADWTDVTAYVRGTRGDYLEIKRGRRNELSGIEPGEATVILDNTDYRFDPTDSTGPYYGDITPMVKIRIGATWDDGGTVTRWLFTGYVERWDVAYPKVGISTATLTCVDGSKYLNLIELTDFNRSQEDSDVRIDAILDEVGWPATERATALGSIEVAAERITQQTALSALNRIARAERGLFFFSGAGNATFQSRVLRNTLLSSGTWGDAADDSELVYSSFTTRFDDSDIWNVIKVTRDGGIEQTATDSTSVTDFFARVLPLGNLPLVDDDAALDTALWTLAQFKDARVRPDVMVIELTESDDLGDVWDKVLNREISDVISINQRTLSRYDTTGSLVQAGFTTSLNAHVEGIQYRIVKGKWRVTWFLSPAFTITPTTGTLNTTDDWLVPTLLGTWANFTSANPETPVGYRREGEYVYLRGTVDGDTAPSNIFYLPAGYYDPLHLQRFIVPDSAGGTSGRIQILDTGAVRLSAGTPWISLNGISFRIV